MLGLDDSPAIYQLAWQLNEHFKVVYMTPFSKLIVVQ